MLEDVGEINDILGRSYGLPDGIDEADLDAELACLGDELESELFEETAVSAPAAADNVSAQAFPQPGYASTLPATPQQQATANTATPISQNINLI